MGDDTIAKYLSTKQTLWILILVILALSGTIISLKDGSISDLVDKKVKYALDCAKFATAEAVEKVDREKLDLGIYISDQKRIESHFEQVNAKIDKIGQNVDMLIRMQLQGRKAVEIDRKATKDWREGQER